MNTQMPTSPLPLPEELRSWFGNIDVYLFDQILKGRIRSEMSVLDAGCGGGRNLVYLMRAGMNVFGMDNEAQAVEVVRQLARDVAPHLPVSNFQEGSLTDSPFGKKQFDVVICNAVLHYAKNHSQFREWVLALWELVLPGGMLFVRCAAPTGKEGQPGAWEFNLSNGNPAFLAPLELLLDLTAELKADQLEPIKTVDVQEIRRMSTWVLSKTE